jgi:large subunit ribosomal protein L15
MVATQGQKSRSGGYHKVGFEGGQMLMHRRLKRGFKSHLLKFNATLDRINALGLADVDDDLEEGWPGWSVKKMSRS